MQDWPRAYAPLIGRILVGGFFLWNGIQQILNLDTMVDIFTQTGLPQPTYLVLGAAALEIVAAMMLVVGFKTRLSAAVLVLYTLAASVLLIYIPGPGNTQIFLGNMAIVGGLLYICAYGSGAWSTER